MGFNYETRSFQQHAEKNVRFWQQAVPTGDAPVRFVIKTGRQRPRQIPDIATKKAIKEPQRELESV